MLSDDFNEKKLEYGGDYADDGEITNSDLLLMKDLYEGDKRRKKVNNDDATEDNDARTEDLGDAERDITNNLGDKDLVINGIQPRYDGIDDIRLSNNNGNLFDDKELYEGNTRDRNGRKQGGN